jgi:hypothetical protein
VAKEDVEEMAVGPEVLVGLGLQDEIGETIDEIRCLMAETLDYQDYLVNLVNLVGRNKIM